MKNIEKIAQNPEKLAKFVVDVDCGYMDCRYCIFSDACSITEDCNDQQKLTKWLESEESHEDDEAKSYAGYLKYLEGFVERRTRELDNEDYSWVKCPPLSYDKWKERLGS